MGRPRGICQNAGASGHGGFSAGASGELARRRNAHAGSSPANAFDSAFPRSVWNGFDLPRVWRRGNRNAVASVLIEKPSRGNWLPLVDCGFDLQYTPLLEHQEAGQRILFCQMDLSGRTENDPAAAALLRPDRRLHTESSRACSGQDALLRGNDAGVELLTGSASP